MINYSVLVSIAFVILLAAFAVLDMRFTKLRAAMSARDAVEGRRSISRPDNS